jgi:LysR family transcriptional regulator, transcriptional activator of the cysJI operon
MQLDTFVVFCDLNHTHSLTATARHLHLTRKAARRQLALLERELNTELADCRHRKIRFTRDGRVCRRYGAQMVAALHRLEAALQQAHALAANEFDLAVCFGIGFHQLPARLRRFQAAHPAARVTVSYATPARVHEAVDNMEAALGLTIHPQHWPGLVLDIIGQEPLAFVCHPQHPFAARPAVSLRELAGQKFIGLRDTPHPAHLEKLPNHLRHRFEPLKECNEVEGVVGLVEIGAGVALLPLVTVQDKVAQGTLAAVPLTGGIYFQPQAVLHRQSRKLTPLMKAFIEFLKQPE